MSSALTPLGLQPAGTPMTHGNAALPVEFEVQAAGDRR